MDSVARRSEATPGHPQDQTIEPNCKPSLHVHDDLLSRIRSLLASRNQQYPLKTPLATPDYTLISQGVNENDSSSFHTTPSYFDLSVANTAGSPSDGGEKRRVFGKLFEEPVARSRASGADSATDNPNRLDLEQSPSVSSDLQTWQSSIKGLALILLFENVESPTNQR